MIYEPQAVSATMGPEFAELDPRVRAFVEDVDAYAVRQALKLQLDPALAVNVCVVYEFTDHELHVLERAAIELTAVELFDQAPRERGTPPLTRELGFKRFCQLAGHCLVTQPAPR
jgi:hypothetical protein